MYLWIAAFAYDEFSGMTDAGVAFYQMDFWKIWNMGIIGTGLAFVITSESLHPRAFLRICLASVQGLASAECVCPVPSGGPSWILGFMLTDTGRIGIVGLFKDGDAVTELSFDILSLEALFLVPR